MQRSLLLCLVALSGLARAEPSQGGPTEAGRSPGSLPPAPVAEPRSPSRLDLGRRSLPLPEGYARVAVEVPPGRLVSLLVLGPPGALAHFAVSPVVVHDALDEDAFLPHVASFVAPEGVEQVWVSVELHAPGRLERLDAPIDEALPAEPPALVGLPWPSARSEGYLLEKPNRYQFARPDVISSLLGAFRDTRRRFRRDPIGVVDLSQWDGLRPATDRGNPHHVSHEGGRDVDIALPSIVEPSTRRDHCDKLVSRDLTTGLCRRGSARGVDYARLAFLLGRLIKGGHVDKVFLDAEFIAPTAEAARRLVQPGYPPWVAERLQPAAGVLRHVAWHTDHVHVRFVGPQGRGAPGP